MWNYLDLYGGHSSVSFHVCINVSPSAEPKYKTLGFPAGSVVKNPPVHAGDKGSVPGLGRSHILGRIHVCATTTEPVF